MRTLGQEDSMFCQFQDSANFLEMYSLAQDPHQLTNIANLLTADTLEYYKVTTDIPPSNIFCLINIFSI